MPRFDLSLHELESYRPDIRQPSDFDDFWAETIRAARAIDHEVVVIPIDTPLRQIDVFDVTFPGFGGDPVKAWLWTPRGMPGPLPTIVEYNGYGGGRGLPHERLTWAAAGYAHLFMDTRGQGGAWGSGGQTPDPYGSGPSAPGFMTRGIEEPSDYYYRRVFTDAVRAVDAVRSLDIVDSTRVAVAGGSQGGGIAIAVGGLVDGLVAVMPDVPFLCHFERAIGMTERDPYQEVVRYLKVNRGRPTGCCRRCRTSTGRISPSASRLPPSSPWRSRTRRARRRPCSRRTTAYPSPTSASKCTTSTIMKAAGASSGPCRRSSLDASQRRRPRHRDARADHADAARPNGGPCVGWSAASDGPVRPAETAGEQVTDP